MTETENQAAVAVAVAVAAAEEGRKVKFLCSFGGSILPRPSDGKLRYAGGETRIVSVGRDVGYRELMVKLKEFSEQEALTLKYQQPDDDLDALVSVLSDEDVCHMMEEYDRLEAGDGLSGRLRLFLFAAGEHQLQQEQQQKLPSGEGNDEQRYVKALNSVTEISRQQSDNKNNENLIKNNVNNGGDLNSSSNNINSNGNSNSNSLLVGNGSETGMAQHVSVALPVSLMKPFSKGVGGLASSPPPSPSHHRAASHHQQVSATSDQYHGRHSNFSQYVYNSNSGQPEPSCDVQGQSQKNLCPSDVQGHEFGPLGQSEHSSHHHYPSIHSMPRPESFQNIQGLEVPPKGQPEHGSQYHHYQHHQECPPHGQESYRVDATVSMVEIPSKGKEEVDGHPLHLAHRVEPYQEIPAAPVVEFPIKGQSEAGSYNQLLPRPHELQQDVAAVSRVEIALNLQPEVGSYQQHLPRLQSDAGNHLQHVVTNITPPRSPQPSQPDTYWKTPGQPGVEYSHRRQRSVGSGIHSGFVGIREEYKQGVVDPFVTHVESHGNLQPLEPQHVNAHSEVAVIVANRDDGKHDSIQSHQCNLHCPTCSRQKDMPVVHHQAAQNSSIEIHCDQECKSSNYYGELSSSNSVQRGTSPYPLCGQSEQVKHIQNDNGLYQESFSDQEYMYGDHRELVHSNMLQNNAFLHSMVEQVEHQISENDIEIERSWNAPPYYASDPQLPHEFSCIPPSADVMDFHLASTSTAREVSLGNAHERYVGNHHYVQVPWAFDEYGNRVDYMSSRLRENLGPLNYHPSSNNYLSGDNHVAWHGQPHFAEKDTRFQGQNLSHLQNTFEGNHLSQWQYAGLQSRQNISEVWVPHLYSEQLLPYSDQYAPDKVNFQNVKEFGQYCPLVSEELSLKVLSTRVDQSKYPGQQPDERVGFHNGQEKQRERVLYDMNDQSEKVRMLRDAKAHGAQALREGMPNTFGQNNPWDHYPRHYEGLHSDDAYYRTEADDFHKLVISDLYEPQIHKALPAESGAGHGKFMDMLGNALQSKVKHMVIETPTDCTSGIHLEPNNVQKDEYHKGGENGCAGSVLYKIYDQDVQRMEHECKSHEMNTLHVTDFPDYMPTDVFQNNANTSYSDSHCLKSSHFRLETGDIKFLTIDPVKMHTSFQSETGMACIPDALSTVENNQIPSSGAFLHAVNFTAAVLLDKLTIPGSSMVSSSVSASSPQRSDNITATTPPIYDKTPANSLSAALPENFWSGTEEGSKFSELNVNGVTENKRMMSTKVQVAAEHGPNDLQTPKQYEEAVDSGMHGNHLNGKVDDSCTSRPMDLPLHGPSIPSSSTTPTSKILDEQNSVGNEKAVVTGMVDKEVKDEDMLSMSDVEENIPQQEATENNPSGLDEDINSGLVDLARSAEAQALAKDLQTIKNADLEEIRELGSGTYGTVYYGKWKGSDVAIKRIKASCFEGRPAEHERLIADFWREATILSQLHHPNVVSFYGVVQDGPGTTLSTVTEFMVNGSLKQVLRKKDRTIDRRKRLILAMDAAFGMEYLHAKNIVHFDLKCENLLVNMRDPHRPICKIGDMGLSKVKHKTLVSGGVRGTLPWMAPELLSGKGGVSDKIDVYSFGIVMWELLTGDEPYSNMHCGSIIGGIMKNTLRPPVPDWCDPAWRSLMERCWSAEPEKRPPFSEISTELRAVAASMNVK